MDGVRVAHLRARSSRPHLVVVLVLALLAACTPTYSTTADTTTTLTPPPRSVLRIGVEEWPACLNPLLCADDALSEQILQHVLPGAYRLDDDNDYVATGLLAEPAEVTVSDDADSPAMTIRYRIDSDARWADGKPITSSDFVGTWRAVMTTPGSNTRGYDLITNVDDRDPLVAVVSFRERFADWRELFGGATNHLLKADAFGATTDLTGLYADDLPFAAGPYQLVSWTENEAVLSRVDNDWDPGRTAEVDQVRLRPIAVDEVSPDSFDLLVPAASRTVSPPEGYTVAEVPTTRVVGVWFDQRSPAMQIPANRQFLSRGLDLSTLATAADDVVPVAGRVGCAGWVPGVGPWCEAAEMNLTQGRAPALSAIAADGWALTPEGLLVRDGQALTMSLTWDPADAAAGSVAAAVSQALVSLGVTVEVGSMPTEQWAGMRGGDAGVGIGVFTLDLGVGPLPSVYDCPNGDASSVLAWCPAPNADTVAALATTLDTEERATLVATLGRRAQNDAVWLPVVQRSEVLYVRTERVSVPELTRTVGGPLAHLAEFTVVS